MSESPVTPGPQTPVPSGTEGSPSTETSTDAPTGSTEPSTGGARTSAARRSRRATSTEGDDDRPPARGRPRPAAEDTTEPAEAAGSAGDDADSEDSARRADRPARRGRGGTAAGGSRRRAKAEPDDDTAAGEGEPDADRNPELPDRAIEGRPKSVEAAERALVPRKPKIGDSMPAPVRPSSAAAAGAAAVTQSPAESDQKPKRRRGGRGRGGAKRSGGAGAGSGGGGGGQSTQSARFDPVEQVLYDEDAADLDERSLGRRKGKERKGRPVGRYLMCVHVAPKATQIAVLEGRSLVEHYVSHPADDVGEIHGNIYLGKVQNVLPGMEAAFVDIGTPKNAVLYRGDVQYDKEDLENDGSGQGGRPRIEQVLRARQTIVCQVTKNPIAHKGARLTQEVSLPGRFVVLIPNSSTYGISKRLPDNERRRLRQILDRVKPPQHGVIVRTAAENVTEEEIERDVRRLIDQWTAIDNLAKRSGAPALLYREPDLALRVIREEFNDDYRGIVIDDPQLFEEVRSYVAAISPTLADRVQYHDPATEQLPLFERYHVHEQRLRALDKKVWLPSGGSLIIEHTEALTVIDVNTGKNVGRSSLEETVYRNNLEAAVEIARQLRLRDIGGIIVIDFVDMEDRGNRDEVIRVFRDALGRDKTRTQVFEISELGLVEMTRKRIGEGLIESVSTACAECEGRGLILDQDLIGEQA